MRESAQFFQQFNNYLLGNNPAQGATVRRSKEKVNRGKDDIKENTGTIDLQPPLCFNFTTFNMEPR